MFSEFLVISKGFGFKLFLPLQKTIGNYIACNSNQHRPPRINIPSAEFVVKGNSKHDSEETTKYTHPIVFDPIASAEASWSFYFGLTLGKLEHHPGKESEPCPSKELKEVTYRDAVYFHVSLVLLTITNPIAANRFINAFRYVVFSISSEYIISSPFLPIILYR